MRICPRCRHRYEDDASFCPKDGAQLVEVSDHYIGQTFLDQFEIREVWGCGSMGTVYKAWQKNMEREVAIKVLRKDLVDDPRLIKRFHREAKASARLSHPNIITVHLVGETDDGVPFLAMEFLQGQSLDDLCLAAGPLPNVRAINITRQILAALAEAHGQNIVHRDLKPENILLIDKKQAPDFVKVLDFGIAKILHADEESLLTQTGAIFGTPYYLAPEQAAGSDIDHRCDLYALGVILFRMLTGQLPFQGHSSIAVLVKHLKEPPPRPQTIIPSITDSLDYIVLKALEKSQETRWQTAEEMGEALNLALSTLSTKSYSIVSPMDPTTRASHPSSENVFLAQTLSDHLTPEKWPPAEPKVAEPKVPQTISIVQVESSDAPRESAPSDDVDYSFSDKPEDTHEINLADPADMSDLNDSIMLPDFLRRRRLILRFFIIGGALLGVVILSAILYARWNKISNNLFHLSPHPSMAPSPRSASSSQSMDMGIEQLLVAQNPEPRPKPSPRQANRHKINQPHQSRPKATLAKAIFPDAAVMQPDTAVPVPDTSSANDILVVPQDFGISPLMNDTNPSNENNEIYELVN